MELTFSFNIQACLHITPPDSPERRQRQRPNARRHGRPAARTKILRKKTSGFAQERLRSCARPSAALPDTGIRTARHKLAHGTKRWHAPHENAPVRAAARSGASHSNKVEILSCPAGHPHIGSFHSSATIGHAHVTVRKTKSLVGEVARSHERSVGVGAVFRAQLAGDSHVRQF